MITKFKITRAPKRATLNILGSLFVLNQEYSITNQSSMNISVSDRGVPYDDFGFKLGNENGTWSSEQNCVINAEVQAGALTVFNINYFVKLNENTPIPFVLEDEADRITIISHDPKYGQFLINGNDAINGKTYMRYELINLVFLSNADVSSQNVASVLSYTKGNNITVSAANTMTFTSTANMASSIQGTTETIGIL